MLNTSCDTRMVQRLVTIGLALAACLAAGCALVGGTIENYRRVSTRTVKAEYEGLGGKTFAVVVSIDRGTQADHPGLLEAMLVRLTERLSANTNVPCAAGFVPAEKVLKYMSNTPGWNSRAYSEIAADLGVQRLVYVDINEYRLSEPRNAYEWAGVASGSVSVVEADSAFQDGFSFERAVTVRFPDGSGYGPEDFTRVQVSSALLSRFVDRATWLFYTHEEPYYPDY